MLKRLWMYYVCGVCGREVERVEARGRFRPLLTIAIDRETVAASVLTSLCGACRVTESPPIARTS